MVDLNLPSNPISVLLVEDDAGSRQLVRYALEAHDPFISYDISEAGDLASAGRLLGERKFDNIILDLELPDSKGLETLRSIKKIEPDVPVVVLSAISDHETAVESIRHGADYYIVKGDMLREMLGRSICFSIERNRRKFNSEDQDKLQGHVDRLQCQIREIQESLTDQISSNEFSEQSIRQLNAEYEQLFDILPAMIWQINKHGKIIRVNGPAAEIIGKKSEDLIGEDFYSLFAASDEHVRLKHGLILQDGTGSEESMEAYKSIDGSFECHLTEVVPQRDKSGAINGLVIMARNPVPKRDAAKTPTQKSVPADHAKTLKEKFSPDSRFMARQAGAVRVENPDRPQRQYSGKVLVVDPDSLNRMLIGSHLKGSGLDVDFAVSGLEAIDKSREVEFDLVLTAFSMPELDGLEVVHRLRQDGYKSPVIVMTSDYAAENIGKIKQAGGTDHIFKPINKKDIFAVFDKHMAIGASAE
ncbi:MAG: response regulator [Phycisphaerae bacterium]|nr:response regulator [Phycisphaerae bacterium]